MACLISKSAYHSFVAIVIAVTTNSGLSQGLNHLTESSEESALQGDNFEDSWLPVEIALNWGTLEDMV